jgi:hypothetical protein
MENYIEKAISLIKSPRDVFINSNFRESAQLNNRNELNRDRQTTWTAIL